MTALVGHSLFQGITSFSRGEGTSDKIANFMSKKQIKKKPKVEKKKSTKVLALLY